jgi:septal ring factor EnvC (AmiA/AmiB activator)
MVPVLAAADVSVWLSPEGVGVIAANALVLVGLLWRTAGKVKAIEDSQDKQQVAVTASLAALEARRQLACSTCRAQVDAAVSAARNDTNMAVQELRQVRTSLSELKQMLAQLQSDVSAIAINARIKLARQPTGPFPGDDGG